MTITYTYSHVYPDMKMYQYTPDRPVYNTSSNTSAMPMASTPVPATKCTTAFITTVAYSLSSGMFYLGYIHQDDVGGPSAVFYTLGSILAVAGTCVGAIAIKAGLCDAKEPCCGV